MTLYIYELIPIYFFVPLLEVLKLLEAVTNSIFGIKRVLARIVRSSLTMSMPCLKAASSGPLASPSLNMAPKNSGTLL